RAARGRVLGQRCSRRQANVVSDGGEAQGRREGGVFLDHMAFATSARRGDEEGDGRSAAAARPEPDAVRWQTADLRRIRGVARRVIVANPAKDRELKEPGPRTLLPTSLHRTSRRGR